MPGCVMMGRSRRRSEKLSVMLSLLGALGKVRSVTSSAMAACFSMRADLRLARGAAASVTSSSLSRRLTKTGGAAGAPEVLHFRGGIPIRRPNYYGRVITRVHFLRSTFS